MEKKKAVGLVIVGWLILSVSVGYLAALTAWTQDTFGERLAAWMLGTMLILFAFIGLATALWGMLEVWVRWYAGSK